MKKLSEAQKQKLLDEQIQQEFHSSEGLEADKKAYQLLFDALEEEPAFQLPVDFSDKITQIVTQQSEAKESTRHTLLVAACVLGGLLLSLGAIFWLDVNFFKNLFQLMGTLKWILIFGLIVLAIIQTGDWFLIMKKRFHRL